MTDPGTRHCSLQHPPSPAANDDDMDLLAGVDDPALDHVNKRVRHGVVAHLKWLAQKGLNHNLALCAGVVGNDLRGGTERCAWPVRVDEWG